MKELVKSYHAEEIAEYLGLNPYTIQRLAMVKKMPAFRASGQWRFHNYDVGPWSKAYPFTKGKPQEDWRVNKYNEKSAEGNIKLFCNFYRNSF